MSRFPSLCALTMSLLAECPACGAELQSGKPEPPSFVLEDQHARVHHLSFPRPRAVILVFADRRSASEVAAWVAPLHARWGERMDILGVASMGGPVPKFLRNRVRQGFRNAFSRPILLDWDNQVSTRFQAQPGQVSVVVLDPQGRPVGRASGKASEESLRELQAALGALHGPNAVLP